MKMANLLLFVRRWLNRTVCSTKKGFTLTELIIVMSISSFVIGASYVAIQSTNRLAGRQTSQINNQNDTRVIMSYLIKDIQNLSPGVTPVKGEGDTLYIVGEARYYKVYIGNVREKNKINIFREVSGKGNLMVAESVLDGDKGFEIISPDSSTPYYVINMTFIDRFNTDNVQSFQISPRKGVVLHNTNQVDTPIANPASGIVKTGTEVTLSSTAGADIYYTLDDTTPTTSSIKYVGPIIVNSAITIKAIAVKDGMLDSSIMTESYTTNDNQVATPVAVPGSSSVEKGTKVSLSTETAGASIYYTLDGTIPTTSSMPYTMPIVINGSTTIKAFAVKAGMTDSLIMTEQYSISSSPKEILSYGFKDIATEYVNINSYGRTVLIQVPVDTNLNNLIANFTLSPGATAKIGSVTQESGVTSNDFSKQFMTYTVIAKDGSQNDWTVYVYTKSKGLILDIINGVTYVYPLVPRFDATGKLVILSGELTVGDTSDFVYTAAEGILVNPVVVLKADHAQSRMIFNTVSGDIDIRGALISTAPNNNVSSLEMKALSGSVDLSSSKIITTLRDIYIEAQNNINLRNTNITISKNNTDLILNAGNKIYYNNQTKLNYKALPSNSDLTIKKGSLTYSP